MLFALHAGLLILNCIWFSKMMVGVQKFLDSQKDEAPSDLKKNGFEPPAGTNDASTLASTTQMGKAPEDDEAKEPLLNSQ